MGSAKRTRREGAEIIPLRRWLPGGRDQATSPTSRRTFLERRELLRGRARERLALSHFPSVLLHLALIGLGPCAGLLPGSQSLENVPMQIALIGADEVAELPPSAQKFLAEYAAQNDATLPATDDELLAGNLEDNGVRAPLDPNATPTAGNASRSTLEGAVGPDALAAGLTPLDDVQDPQNFDPSQAPVGSLQTPSRQQDSRNTNLAASTGVNTPAKPDPTEDGPLGWLHWVRTPKNVESATSRPKTRNISTQDVNAKETQRSRAQKELMDHLGTGAPLFTLPSEASSKRGQPSPRAEAPENDGTGRAPGHEDALPKDMPTPSLVSDTPVNALGDSPEAALGARPSAPGERVQTPAAAERTVLPEPIPERETAFQQGGVATAAFDESPQASGLPDRQLDAPLREKTRAGLAANAPSDASSAYTRTINQAGLNVDEIPTGLQQPDAGTSSDPAYGGPGQTPTPARPGAAAVVASQGAQGAEGAGSPFPAAEYGDEPAAGRREAWHPTTFRISPEWLQTAPGPTGNQAIAPSVAIAAAAEGPEPTALEQNDTVFDTREFSPHDDGQIEAVSSEALAENAKEAGWELISEPELSSGAETPDVEFDAQDLTAEQAANAPTESEIEEALFGPDGWAGLDQDATASSRSLVERDAEQAQAGGGIAEEAAPLTLGQRLQLDWDGNHEKLRRGSESKMNDDGKGGERGRGAPAQLGIPGVKNATVVPEERPLELEALVATRTHPLAPLAERIDRTLRANWTFPVEYKFMGLTGRTKIEFRVLPNGDIVNVHVIRKSGHVELDELALDAVPKRIPKITEPVPEKGIVLQFSFVYRNSPVAGSE